MFTQVSFAFLRAPHPLTSIQLILEHSAFIPSAVNSTPSMTRVGKTHSTLGCEGVARCAAAGAQQGAH